MRGSSASPAFLGVFPEPVKVGAKAYWSRAELDKAPDRLFDKHELVPCDWCHDAPLYKGDPRYHFKLREWE